MNILFLFFTFLFAINSFAFAENEAIENFQVTLNIQNDGSIFVRETIIYNFGDNLKHGLIREIPLVAPNGPRLNIQVLNVENENGEPYNYTFSFINDSLNIKIGDPNKFVSGLKTYKITYQVFNALRQFSDHDELYWNVTGNEWQVPIKNASALVILPFENLVNVEMDCFTGPKYSTERSCVFNQNGKILSYTATRPLNIGEGLTIVFGLPKGLIQNIYVPPQKLPKESDLNKNFVLIAFGFFVFVFLLTFGKLFLRTRQGFRPKPHIPRNLKSQPVVVEYEPPNNLLPIDVGTILDRQVDLSDLASLIIDLAVKGYLKIRYLMQEIKFWPDKKDFEFIKVKEGTDLTHPAYKIIFDILFGGREKVTLTDLARESRSFQWQIRKLIQETETHLAQQGYFDLESEKKLNKLKLRLWLLLICCFFLSFGVFAFSFLFRQISSKIFFLAFGLIFSIFIIISHYQLRPPPPPEPPPANPRPLKPLLLTGEIFNI